jgi:hypothetical protein
MFAVTPDDVVQLSAPAELDLSHPDGVPHFQRGGSVSCVTQPRGSAAPVHEARAVHLFALGERLASSKGKVKTMPEGESMHSRSLFFYPNSSVRADCATATTAGWRRRRSTLMA